MSVTQLWEFSEEVQMENWTQVTNIWEGLENFRQFRRDIFRIGVKQINPESLDKLFAGYDFKLSSKHGMLDMINVTLEKAQFEDEKTKQDLLAQKLELEKIYEDLSLYRIMKSFEYEFIFKEEGNDIKGFVKIFHKTNPNHVGLLQWDDKDDPILYLYEVEDGHMRLHVNYGAEGLSIIEKATDLSYRWTHCLQEGYLEVIHAECGSAIMSRMTKNIKLEHSNLSAIEAAKRASSVQANGKTLLENNIELLQNHEPQLKKLIEIRASQAQGEHIDIITVNVFAEISDRLKERASKIKLIGLDVDGVLTDGTVFIGEHGEQFKNYSAFDGLGIRMARQFGIDVAIISGRESIHTHVRFAKGLDLKEVHTGVKDKLALAEKLLKKYSLEMDQMAFIGDDTIDVTLLEKVGLAACPPEAHYSVLKHIHYITERAAGKGSAREFIDLILHSQGKIPGQFTLLIFNGKSSHTRLRITIH